MGGSWGGVAALAASVLASAAFTWLWIDAARRRGLVDLPGRRRMHAIPVPRGGGIAIAIVLAAVMTGFVVFDIDRRLFWLAALSGLMIEAGTGLRDDLQPLTASAKLIGQGLGALPLAVFTARHGDQGFSLAAFALTLLLVVALVNIWNFMDGSDGLVTVQTLVLALVALVAGAAGHGFSLGAFAGLLAAACLGFLPFNLPRAKVFLGDCGSHVLGFGVALLVLIAYTDSSTEARPFVWLIIAIASSAMWLDAAMTLAHRLFKGRTVWHAHREHLYQLMLRRGASHGQVLGRYLLWTVAFGVMALLVSEIRPGALPALAVANLLSAVSLYLIWRKRLVRGRRKMGLA